jgi:TrmH family RNA methyltransferase
MPMKGRADSLNAAVAGAVLAYEVLASVTPG